VQRKRTDEGVPITTLLAGGAGALLVAGLLAVVASRRDVRRKRPPMP
jgi:hypothetical protein